MATDGYSTGATFDEVGNSFSEFYNYTHQPRACDHQSIFYTFQQAPAVGNLQAVETKEVAGPSMEHQSQSDFTNELEVLLSGAANMINGFDGQLSSEASQRQILASQPELQPGAEMVCGANLKNQSTTEAPFQQEQRVVLLKRQQEMLEFILQQNQNLINLLQQKQCPNPLNDLPPSNTRQSRTATRSFQDGNVPVKSRRCDPQASPDENVAQIYANAARLTTVTDGLPFSSDCSAPSQSSVESSKPNDRAVKLEATFKRIDAMYAALQRSQEEKAKRQQQNKRHVKRSQPRSKLAPAVIREKYSEARGTDQHEDHLQLCGSSVPCQSVLQARSGGTHAYGGGIPPGPNHSDWDSLDVYGEINQPTGWPNQTTPPEDFMVSKPAEDAALAQESFLSTLLKNSPSPGYSGTKMTPIYPTYFMQEKYGLNCGANQMIDAQHEECIQESEAFAIADDGTALVSGSPTWTITRNSQNADPIDTFVYELFTDASKYGSMEYEDVNELIDDFLSEEISRDACTDSTNLSQPKANDNCVRIEAFGSENNNAAKSTTAIEAIQDCQKWQDAQQSSSEPSVDEGFLGDASLIEPGLPNIEHIPEVDSVDFHVFQSDEDEMRSAQTNAQANTSSVHPEHALYSAMSSSGVNDLAEQVRIKEFLLSHIYSTALLAFPDRQELTDAAMRTKFAHEFDHPNAISVFTSFIEGSLEENGELLENRKKALFFRTVDAHTSMVRERELGHPDLSELIERMNELTEVVGGYWPVSDKAVWMLGFMHANELRYFQTMMAPEWSTKIGSASTSQDAAICTFFGLRDLLISFGDADETKNKSGLSKNLSEDTESHVRSKKQNSSLEYEASALKASSVSSKRKSDHKDEEELPSPKRSSVVEDIDLFTGEGCNWSGIL